MNTYERGSEILEKYTVKKSSLGKYVAITVIGVATFAGIYLATRPDVERPAAVRQDTVPRTTTIDDILR